MASKHYDEAKVLASVSKKCVVNRGNKIISYNPSNHQIGNGTWGKIDYLTKYCGWTLLKDNSVNGGRKVDVDNYEKSKVEEIKIRKMK